MNARHMSRVEQHASVDGNKDGVHPSITMLGLPRCSVRGACTVNHLLTLGLGALGGQRNESKDADEQAGPTR